MSAPGGLPSRRGWLGRLVALGVGVALLAGTEAVLRWVGVRPLTLEDRFVGFDGGLPLFERVEREGRSYQVVAAAKEPYFNTAPFLDPKPPGAFRIAFFGGSTTYGHPYLATTAFPRWTAMLLNGCDPRSKCEDINVGGISYASYRVLRLMEELATFEPDLYVVLSGHNEFLERRTYGGLVAEPPALRGLRAYLHRFSLYSLLLRGAEAVVRGGRDQAPRTVLADRVEAVLEQVGGPDLYHRDDEFREDVLAHYRQNLELMVRVSRARGIPLILCTLPVNLRGVSPFKSEHAKGLTAEQLEGWAREFAAGEAALNRGAAEEALECFRRAEALDDRFALLHFRMGQAFDRLGRTAEAYGAFDRAKEEDIIPLRALNAMNEAVRAVAAGEGVPLADVEALFRRLAADGIPGKDWFLDHVHPTLEGQQWMAWAVADTAIRAGLVPVGQSAWDSWQAAGRELLRQALAEVPPRYRAMGSWVVGRTYFWAGKDDEAYEALTEAHRVVRNIAEIPYRLGWIELQRNNPGRALEYFAEAEVLAPADPVVDLTPQVRLATARAHLAAGNPHQALARLSVLAEAGAAYAADVLVIKARALHAAGQGEEAAIALAEAERASRHVPGFGAELAEGYRALGRGDEARSRYREYLRFTKDPAPEAALRKWEGQPWARP